MADEKAWEKRWIDCIPPYTVVWTAYPWFGETHDPSQQYWVIGRWWNEIGQDRRVQIGRNDAGREGLSLVCQSSLPGQYWDRRDAEILARIAACYAENHSLEAIAEEMGWAKDLAEQWEAQQRNSNEVDM